MKKNISIIGAGGHTRSSMNLLQDFYKNSIFSIYDDSYKKGDEEFIHGVLLKGSIASLPKNQPVFLSIGDNYKRAEMFSIFSNLIIEENLIHKNSIIENKVGLGKANQIFANTYINSYTIVGHNNIINTSAVLEHEVVIGNHNHISVSTILCGRVKIGNKCMIGAGATIIDNISICDEVTIGSQAVVVDDIKEPGIYVGIPARKIK